MLSRDDVSASFRVGFCLMGRRMGYKGRKRVAGKMATKVSLTWGGSENRPGSMDGYGEGGERVWDLEGQPSHRNQRDRKPQEARRT